MRRVWKVVRVNLSVKTYATTMNFCTSIDRLHFCPWLSVKKITSRANGTSRRYDSTSTRASTQTRTFIRAITTISRHHHHHIDNSQNRSFFTFNFSNEFSFYFFFKFLSFLVITYNSLKVCLFVNCYLFCCLIYLFLFIFKFFLF